MFVFSIKFETKEEVEAIRVRYAEGIAWGEMKQFLFEYLNDILKDAREKYFELLENPQHIEKVLQEGAAKARDYASPFMQKLRKATGIRPLI